MPDFHHRLFLDPPPSFRDHDHDHDHGHNLCLQLGNHLFHLLPFHIPYLTESNIVVRCSKIEQTNQDQKFEQKTSTLFESIEISKISRHTGVFFNIMFVFFLDFTYKKIKFHDYKDLDLHKPSCLIEIETKWSPNVRIIREKGKEQWTYHHDNPSLYLLFHLREHNHNHNIHRSPLKRYSPIIIVT